MQCAIRPRPALGRLPRDRGERPAEPFVGAGVQSDRLSAGFHRREIGPRIRPARAEKQRHQEHDRLLRTGARLHRLQNPALGPRQVQRRFARVGFEHEIGRRSDGHRPQLRRSNPERVADDRTRYARFRREQRVRSERHRRRAEPSDRQTDLRDRSCAEKGIHRRTHPRTDPDRPLVSRKTRKHHPDRKRTGAAQ